MTTKKIYERLSSFIDARVVEEDGQNDQMKDIFHEYVTMKVKSLLERNTIRLKGDDVYVAEKRVGTVNVDGDDIEYAPEKGEKSTFSSMDDLYAHIAEEHGVTEGRVEDAVFKQDTGREARKARWTNTRQSKRKEGTPGDYEGGTLDPYHDKIKGKAGEAAYSDAGTKPKRLDKGYYDSHDPRTKHDDPIKGKSVDPAYPHGKPSKLDKGYYDSHDVRKKHNK